MSDIVIKAENIGKLYKLGEIGTGTISHDLNRWWARMRGKEDPFAKIGQANDRTVKGDNDWVWALQDINFEVKQGDALGIIGRNGAGKSTLLKILSKVTTPTTGRIKVKGRIASLLEVGTGFHPELTGRENIFLNGAILGMTRSEIKSKFDEIVDFAGVERYIDTPVKRYSSGMYVRLAFAVAAHLESEILIVDEVLAVGDAEFQKKCLGKMQDVSKGEGRTVLFVSHNMAAVKDLCTDGIVLNNGNLTYNGTSEYAVLEYQKSTKLNYIFKCDDDVSNCPGNDLIKIIEFSVKPINKTLFDIETDIQVDLVFFNFKANINLDATFELRTIDEIIVYHTGALITRDKDSIIGKYKVSYIIPRNMLNAGNYYFRLIFGENQRYLLYSNDKLIAFEIQNVALGTNTIRLPGVIRPDFSFNVMIIK